MIDCTDLEEDPFAHNAGNIISECADKVALRSGYEWPIDMMHKISIT